MAKYDTSSPHFSAGMRLQSQGRFKEALACFEAWLQKEPTNVVGWNCKGLALRGLARWDEAMACFDQALKVFPNDEPTWGNMGRTLHDKGDYKAAILVLDQCLEVKPSADLWSFKGSCLGKLGQAQAALSCFDKAVAIEPGKAEYWSNKGTACAQLGRFDDALSSYKKALEAEPNCAAAWYNRAEAEERLGQPEAAVQSLEKFLSLAPASMQSQTADARERAQRLKRLAEAKAGSAPTSEESISGNAEQELNDLMADSMLSAALDLSERIKQSTKQSPLEWHGEQVMTAERTLRVPGLGLLGAVTLKGVITREGSRYKCSTEIICLPMASKHEEKELFDSLDEAKEKITQSWAAEAGALGLVLKTMEELKHR